MQIRGWLIAGLMGVAPLLVAQHSIDGYIAEPDPQVQQRLMQWQDAKFGLFMHWGIYSQWGVDASWSLCSEDMGWNPREKGRSGDYEKYKEDYRNLRKEFNPIRFNPDKWATAAREAGMRYMVLTTKHHDGFCMFDTRTTDFRITSPECPFHAHPRANITKETFDAFRARGFMIGAYFSKADWSSEDYWWPYFATPDRHVNYDPAKYPERWNRFKEFTYRQIEELMTGYGTVDILWLDGGWVRPLGNIPKRFEWWAKKGSWNQDIDIERIAVTARTHQPGLIIVDRTVAGRFENYVTPEGSVPDDPIPVPWETCLTMGIGQWAFKPNQQFLPARILVHLLVDNVSKGGNLLLNIGPGPDGDWPDTAYARLKEIGDWMRVNSEAIHGTRSMTPYRDGRVRFTRQKNSATVYAVYLGEEHEGAPPARVVLNSFRPDRGASITMLGVEGELRWQGHEGGCTIEIPESVRNNPPCAHAWVIRILR